MRSQSRWLPSQDGGYVDTNDICIFVISHDSFSFWCDDQKIRHSTDAHCAVEYPESHTRPEEPVIFSIEDFGVVEKINKGHECKRDMDDDKDVIEPNA